MERHFNGGGGSWNPVEIVSDAFSSVGDALADIDPGPAIGQAGAEVDNFVNREIPGGWALPAIVAVTVATGYFDPTLLAAEGAGAGAFTGATETGLATLAGEGALADTVGTTLLAGGGGGSGFVGLDAATAAELGLSGGSGLGIEGAAGDVLAGLPTSTVGSGFAGLTPEYAAELGLEGTSGLGIEGASGDVLAGIPTGSTSAQDVLSAANRARSLANMLQGGQQMGTNQPNMGMPQFEQFGGLYRGNQNPFLVPQQAQVAPLQRTQNFLQELAEQGKPSDLASLLRNA